MVYLLKETLPTLIIIFFGFLLALIATAKKFVGGFSRGIKYFFTDYLGNNFAEFSMLVFVILYWAYSMKSPLNIGIRHLLPTFPFIYILAAGAWKKIFNSFPQNDKSVSIREEPKSYVERKVNLIPKAFLFVLLAWSVFETGVSGPYFLSYFNQLGGGVYGGYKLVTDSNYDWGQDLLRLKTFVDERNNDNNPDNDILKIAVDYFGGGNPKYYLGDKEVDWQSSKGNPFKARTNADLTQNYAEKSPNEYAIKWLAVSVNTLQSAIQPLAPGQSRNPGDGYEWLVKLRPYGQKLGEVPTPDYRVGTSIFIYKL